MPNDVKMERQMPDEGGAKRKRDDGRGNDYMESTSRISLSSDSDTSNDSKEYGVKQQEDTNTLPSRAGSVISPARFVSILENASTEHFISGLMASSFCDRFRESFFTLNPNLVGIDLVQGRLFFHWCTRENTFNMTSEHSYHQRILGSYTSIERMIKILFRQHERDYAVDDEDTEPNDGEGDGEDAESNDGKGDSKDDEQNPTVDDGIEQAIASQSCGPLPKQPVMTASTLSHIDERRKLSPDDQFIVNWFQDDSPIAVETIWKQSLASLKPPR